MRLRGTHNRVDITPDDHLMRTTLFTIQVKEKNVHLLIGGYNSVAE